MSKRIKYEETETHLKLWVDGILQSNINKKFAEMTGVTPFQFLCNSVNMQCAEAGYPYIWEIWLAELLDEVLHTRAIYEVQTPMIISNHTQHNMLVTLTDNGLPSQHLIPPTTQQAFNKVSRVEIAVDEKVSDERTR